MAGLAAYVVTSTAVTLYLKVKARRATANHCTLSWHHIVMYSSLLISPIFGVVQLTKSARRSLSGQTHLSSVS